MREIEVDRLPHPIADVDAQGALQRVNQAWRAAFGPTEGLDLIDLVEGSARPRVQGWLDGGEPVADEVRMRGADGEQRWYRLVALATNGDRPRWVVSAFDVEPLAQAGRELSDQLAARDKMLDFSVDCIKVIDLTGRVVHMNRSGRAALGVTEAQAVAGFGMKWLELLPPEIARRGQRALRRARAGDRSRFAGMSVAADGSVQHWDNLLTPLLDDHGVTTLILCVSREVTRQRQAELRLRRASETDHLTGLLNRRSFDTRLRRMLGQARQESATIGVALIDLDHFKHVNDTLGHAAGDRLLRTVAARLTAQLPHGAVAGRLGGDEIVVALDGVASREAFRDLVSAIVADCVRPVDHKGRRLRHSMSVGCAIFPDDAVHETALLACADAALGDVKGSGRGGVALFEPEMLCAAERIAEQLRLAREVVRSADGLVPVYQPTVRLDTGEVIGLEALLRWRDGTELMTPSSIEAAFDDFELATQLGAQMHEAVIADLAGWMEQGLPVVPIALNVAPVELLRGDFATSFLDQLRTAGLPTSVVQLEVTERVLAARGAEVAIATLHRLRKAGVAIVLDDFGMGHSSLSRLSEYPIDVVKIDKGFISRLGADRSALAIVKAVVALGEALDAGVIAEGIETVEQRDLVLASGCQVGQGHLTGMPMVASRVVELLGTTAARVTRAG